jgi:hypothetical protein
MTDPGTQDDDTTIDPQDDDTTAPPDDLKDAGKNALDRMKARVKTANAAAARAKAEADQIRAAAANVDPEAIEKRVRAQMASEFAGERALDKLEVKAATMSVDPEVARALLASRVNEFVKDGKVDTAAIEAALTKLVEDKPYLAARAKRFAGSADNGARGATPAPSDMNALIRRSAGIS